MNPRIYEALACGALVVSERRSEIEQLCPEMPVFDGPEDMVALMHALLNNPRRFNSVRRACIRRLACHTYAHRLYTAFTLATGMKSAPSWSAYSSITTPARDPLAPKTPQQPAHPLPPLLGWDPDPAAVGAANGAFRLHQRPPTPGSEAGLIGLEVPGRHSVVLRDPDRAGRHRRRKIHQLDQRDQTSNSYHLMIDGANAYIARHDHVFHSFKLPSEIWHTIALAWTRGTLRVQANGNTIFETHDSLLPRHVLLESSQAPRHCEISRSPFLNPKNPPLIRLHQRFSRRSHASSMSAMILTLTSNR